MERDINSVINHWLKNKLLSSQEKKEIHLLKQNDKNLKEAFYKDLEFGTGGMRGIMGIGTNRVNKYTIGKATQGLSNYLNLVYPNQKIKVAIAYDTRNNSAFFAETTANVFSSNGIEVFIFKSSRPTPELSFTIKQLNCQSGVVITASHNPKEYNGYKAYWSDGAQLITPHDNNVIEQVNKINHLDEIKFAKNDNLISNIGNEIDNIFLQKIKSNVLDVNPPIELKKKISIVYTPLHGTGYKLVPRCLKMLGYDNIHLVSEQTKPNGDFPTVEYPNPEEPKSLTLSMIKAKSCNADLILATDPDADRVSVAVKDFNNDYLPLTGNQTGSLLTYYLLEQWKTKKKLLGKEYIVKTIVTTDLIQNIAKSFNVKCYNTLTGFKYIAQLIKKLEGKESFIMGSEESYGYMVGDFVRDKDAITACALVSEMCAWAFNNKKTLFDSLVEIYIKFGFYKEKMISITKTGIEGKKQITNIMKQYREKPPTTFAKSKVVQIDDYFNGYSTNLLNNKNKKINLSKSNVLQFKTEDNYLISLRPSGTEPKIKFYISVNTILECKEQYDAQSKILDDILNQIALELKID